MLPLHDRNQILSDVVQLVTSKQVGNLAARQDVVHVFQEGFVLNVIVGEEERDSFSLLTSDTVQSLQILQQVTAAVRPGQSDLEGLVSSDVRSQPGQTLLPRPTNADQQGVPLRRP